MHNNRISVFPVWKLSTLPQLSYISLTNNSWICDCSFVEHLQQFVRQLTTLDTSLLECLGPEGRVDIGFGSNTSCANSFVVPVSHRIGVEHQQSVVALHICQTETDTLGRVVLIWLSHALNFISHNILHQPGVPGDNAQPVDWTGHELPVPT